MSRFRPATTLVLAAVLVLTVAAVGCGDDEGDSDTESGATSDPTVAGSSFPVTVVADNGDVTIEESPDAIVVLSPSLTEMLYAIGAGDQVIAVDTSSDHPEGTPITDLSGFRPNVEAIGELGPDLVVLGRDRDDIVATLGDIGVPVLLLEAAADLDEVYGQITTLGSATGHTAEAAELVDTMRTDIDELVASVPERDEPLRYFYELSGDYHTITSDTFVGSILGRLGLESIADGVDPAAGPFPQISAEYVLDTDPDLVFFAHGDGSVPTDAEVAARPGWDRLSAVTDGGLVFLDVDVASRWGPRLVELVDAVVAAIRERPAS